MDIPFLASAMTAVIVAALTCICFWVFNRRRQHTFFEKHGIPGPKPDLFAGNWLQLSEDRLEVMERWIEQYGKVFGFYLGEAPYMVIADTELIKQCFVRDTNLAFDRPKQIFNTEILSSNLVALAGEEWKQVRATLNPLFTSTNLKMMAQIITNCSDNMLEVIDDAAGRGEIVDMEEVSRGFSMDVMTKSTLGWQVDCQKDPNHPFLNDFRKFFDDGDNQDVVNAIRFPFLRKLMNIFYPYSSKGPVIKDVAGHILNMIDLRRRGQNAPSTDILQMMLDTQRISQSATAGTEKAPMILEDRHLLSNCLIFMIAGFHTTAVSLALVMHVLAKYHEEQERVFTEIVKALPDGEEITYGVVQQLKRLDMVLCETLRLYPPAVLFTSRACNKDTTVMGHFFPAGVNVLAPTWHIHHDPELWTDPFKFDPERFSEGAKSHPGYLPFGVGPRVCIGMRLALLEVKIAVCSIVRRYKIFQCDQTQDPIKFHVTPLVMRPEKGIRLRLERR